MSELTTFAIFLIILLASKYQFVANISQSKKSHPLKSEQKK